MLYVWVPYSEAQGSCSPIVTARITLMIRVRTSGAQNWTMDAAIGYCKG